MHRTSSKLTVITGMIVAGALSAAMSVSVVTASLEQPQHISLMVSFVAGALTCATVALVKEILENVSWGLRVAVSNIENRLGRLERAATGRTTAGCEEKKKEEASEGYW